ncbi:hypothetical protein PO909_008263 [Leuciscus waleckii]
MNSINKAPVLQIINLKKIVLGFSYPLKCNLFQNHYNMLICCSGNISYYYQC